VTPQSTTAGSLLVGQTDIFFVADNAVKESAYMQVRVACSVVIRIGRIGQSSHKRRLDQGRLLCLLSTVV